MVGTALSTEWAGKSANDVTAVTTGERNPETWRHVRQLVAFTTMKPWRCELRSTNRSSRKALSVSALINNHRSPSEWTKCVVDLGGFWFNYDTTRYFYHDISGFTMISTVIQCTKSSISLEFCGRNPPWSSGNVPSYHHAPATNGYKWGVTGGASEAIRPDMQLGPNERESTAGKHAQQQKWSTK